MNDEVYFWHTDKQQSQCHHFKCAYPGLPKVSKIRNLRLQKNIEDEVDFLPADKQKFSTS